MNYQELAIEATKATPPVTVSSMVIAGVALQDWVLILTGVYTVTQFGFLLYDRWRKRGRKD